MNAGPEQHVATYLWFLDSGFGSPLIVALNAFAVIAAATFLAMAQVMAGVSYLSRPLRVPLYVMWKLPIYARLLTKRQVDWVRTKCGQEPTDDERRCAWR